MTTLFNPLEVTLEVVISGKEYVLKPKSTLTLGDEEAKYWKEFIHQFLEIVSDEPIKEVKEKKVKEETKETK